MPREAWAQAAVRDRVKSPISGSWRRLRGGVAPLARPEFDRGPVEGSLPLSRITMVFRPTESQQMDLSALLDGQQDPSSSDFHRWLTPEEFANRFGLSASDLAKIVSWLESQGFNVIETARSRTWVAFSGTAAQVDAAFDTAIHRYQTGVESHYANALDPSVPDALAGVVLGIRSLNDFRPAPREVRVRRIPKASGPLFSEPGPGGLHFLAPDDFATIYGLQALYHSGITGAGEKIAVMGQTDFASSDISAFRQAAGLAARQPSVVLVPGSPDPGTVKSDVTEADLDLEWAGGVAPGASIIYVNSTNAFDSFQYAIDQNLAPVISISFGGCEAAFDAAARSSLALSAMQANAQGITITSASGDSGAADCDGSPSSPAKVAIHGLAVDFPGSMPYVTGVGGTRLDDGSGNFWAGSNNSQNGSALSYIPEYTWNDTTEDGALAATGGGASSIYPKAGWQWGAGVPDDGARDVPDVALSASAQHDGYLICSQGSCVNGFSAKDGSYTIVGGTSVGAPSFAAIMALIDQKTGSAQGNVNYVLYPLAARSGDVFHDITIGSNKVPCKAGTTDCPNGVEIGYNAGPGYDQATGLGSVDALNLANEWASVTPAPRGSEDFQLTASPSALSVSAGTSGSSTITLAPLNKFAGTVALTCSVATTLTGATCTLAPASLVSSGAATLTVTIPAQGASLPGSPESDGRFEDPLLPPAIAALFLLMAAGPLVAGWRRRGRGRRYGAALSLACVLTLVLAAGLSCGGSGSATPPSSGHSTPPPVTGKITVRGVSGNLQHLADVTVTVK